MSEKKPNPIYTQKKRENCPVCGQVSYSQNGIHPQCAVKLVDDERKVEIKRRKLEEEDNKKRTKEEAAAAEKTKTEFSTYLMNPHLKFHLKRAYTIKNYHNDDKNWNVINVDLNSEAAQAKLHFKMEDVPEDDPLTGLGVFKDTNSYNLW